MELTYIISCQFDLANSIDILDGNDIGLRSVLASQHDPFEACGEDTSSPLASTREGLRRWNYHQHIFVPLDDPHHTDSASLFDVAAGKDDASIFAKNTISEEQL